MSDSKKKVLILFPYENNMPGFVAFDAGLRSSLKNAPYGLDIYVETMDLLRFPGNEYLETLVDLYHRKYDGMKLDLVVACLRPSFDFLVKYENELFRGVPILLTEYGYGTSGADEVPRSGIAVVKNTLEIESTLALALDLQPDASRVFVLSGVSLDDLSLQAASKESFQSYEGRLDFTYLSGMSLDEILRRVSSLPEHSILFYLSIQKDGTGTPLLPQDVLPLISSQANAPVYGISETYLGLGIVGGHVINFSTMGARTGEAALRILSGEKPGEIILRNSSQKGYLFDARQLKRWGIGEDSLPPGSVVRYKDFSPWETYRWQILGAIAVVIAQAVLISMLLLNLRKRRVAERALRDAEVKYRTVADFTYDWEYWMGDDGRFIYLSPASERITGYSVREFVENPSLLQEILFPEDRWMWEAHVVEQRKEPETCSIQFRIVTKDGAVRWIDHACRRVTGLLGESRGIRASNRDITERKLSEEALRESEQLSQALLASLQNQIAILDKDGRILSVNQAWEESARQAIAALLDGCGVGDNYLEACRRSIRSEDDEASRVHEGIQAVLNGESSTFNLEYSCDSPLGFRWFMLKVIPLRRAEGGVVISHTDVSERKNAELDAQRRREELAHIARLATAGELATSLAHEINQPLTAILCNAEAARRFLSGDAPDLEEIRQILDDIIKDDSRAGDVIRRLRTLIKKGSIQYEPVDLNELVQESIAIVHSTSVMERHLIVARLDAGLPLVRGDRVQLQQVILNLLLNALAVVSDSPPGSGKVVIETALGSDGTARVCVTDSGPGIDENVLDRIFEPFYSTKPDGLGMGLPISRTIIKAHGGAIWAEDKTESTGATIAFTIPLVGVME